MAFGAHGTSADSPAIRRDNTGSEATLGCARSTAIPVSGCDASSWTHQDG